jgi:hypothetical protein
VVTPIREGGGLDPRASFPVSGQQKDYIRRILAFADGVETADPQDVQTAQPQGSDSESDRSPVLDHRAVDPYWQPRSVPASGGDGRHTPLQGVSTFDWESDDGDRDDATSSPPVPQGGNSNWKASSILSFAMRGTR